MKVRLLPALFLLLGFFISLSANAQQNDRVEVFGGYAYTGYSVFALYSGPWQRDSFNGWEASAAFKLVPHLGAEVDFGGGYSSTNGHSDSLRTYLVGPRISADFHGVSIYGHALFGELIFSGASGYANGNGSFATTLGGGADYWISRHIGVRLIQADYLRNNNTAAAQSGTGGIGPGNNFRIATGAVFRFGR